MKGRHIVTWSGVLAITLGAGLAVPHETVAMRDLSDSQAVADGVHGWHALTTGGGTPLAAWVSRDENDAPGGGKVLALAATNHSSNSAFNLSLDDSDRFKDGKGKAEDLANGIKSALQAQQNAGGR